MADAIARMAVRARMRVLLIATIDGAPAGQGEIGRAFAEAGFTLSGGGLIWRKSV